MKKFTQFGLLALAIAGLLSVAPTSFAQQQGGGQGGGGGGGGAGGGGGGGGGRGNRNFDPAQMQQRRMERYREMLEIKADDEWKAIEPLITKVTEAQRDVTFAGMARMFRGGPGGQGGPGGPNGGGPGGGRGPFGGTPSPEEEALQKAVTSGAPAAELKSALTKYRESRKAKEAKLATAQENLRQVLSAKQEAQAVLAGLLN